jgi:glycosyltransferase involved in cell wall biosynthesis
VLEHAHKSGLTEEEIIFTDEVEYHTVAQMMRKSTALVMFSNTESMSCVVAEALCCGLPVISTPTGIARDVIDSSNGIIVAKRDVNQLADAMYRVATGLFKYDRKQISQKAIDTYNYDVIGKQLLNLYK